MGSFSFVGDTHIASVIALWGLEALTHESPDLRAGEYCPSELSVDCLRISYRTWAAWALDVMVPWNLWVSYDWISSGGPRVGWRILIILGPGGLFLGNPWVLDPEVLSWIRGLWTLESF